MFKSEKELSGVAEREPLALFEGSKSKAFGYSHLTHWFLHYGSHTTSSPGPLKMFSYFEDVMDEGPESITPARYSMHVVSTV